MVPDEIAFFTVSKLSYDPTTYEMYMYRDEEIELKNREPDLMMGRFAVMRAFGPGINGVAIDGYVADLRYLHNAIETDRSDDGSSFDDVSDQMAYFARLERRIYFLGAMLREDRSVGIKKENEQYIGRIDARPFVDYLVSAVDLAAQSLQVKKAKASEEDSGAATEYDKPSKS